MLEARTLDIFLRNTRVGTLTALDGERSIFSFSEDYVRNLERDTLSLSFKDQDGALFMAGNRVYRQRLQPFFSNLLPEGALRDYLAGRTGTHISREFPLLARLGADLPGAVRAVPSDAAIEAGLEKDAGSASISDPARFRFSLAGVQLKFSALKNKDGQGGLTIPTQGEGGHWIVKLPSTRVAELPENEFAMMTLAARLGIDVPSIELVRLDQIEGLPEGIAKFGDTAFAIRRFDRSAMGSVHTEDFAQVYGVYPEAKYDQASYRSILSVLAIETDARSIDQFVRRLTFSVLIGNGDMHLKNWSLIYPDGRTPELAPAYDLVSTIPYIPNDQAALKFLRSKEWASFDFEALAAMANNAKLAQAPVIDAARETVEQFDQLWSQEAAHLPISTDIRAAIEAHRRSLAV